MGMLKIAQALGGRIGRQAYLHVCRSDRLASSCTQRAWGPGMGKLTLTHVDNRGPLTPHTIDHGVKYGNYTKYPVQ